MITSTHKKKDLQNPTYIPKTDRKLKTEGNFLNIKAS